MLVNVSARPVHSVLKALKMDWLAACFMLVHPVEQLLPVASMQLCEAHNAHCLPFHDIT